MKRSAICSRSTAGPDCRGETMTDAPESVPNILGDRPWHQQELAVRLSWHPNAPDAWGTRHRHGCVYFHRENDGRCPPYPDAVVGKLPRDDDVDDLEAL